MSRAAAIHSGGRQQQLLQLLVGLVSRGGTDRPLHPRLRALLVVWGQAPGLGKGPGILALSCRAMGAGGWSRIGQPLGVGRAVCIVAAGTARLDFAAGLGGPRLEHSL